MSNKKACILTSVCSMIDQFNLPNIALLQNKGYEVHVVTNFETGSTTPQERVDRVRRMLEHQGVKTIHMPVPRSIFDISGILKSLAQMKKLCRENAYELIHCHSPIGGVIARVGARRSRRVHGTRTIYTAHGFHFFRGAPLVNWILFYPIEKLCARFTDLLITINREDFSLAKRKLKAGRIAYVPGVGIDLKKFDRQTISEETVAEMRKSLGVNEREKMLLSVGEVSKNKNHEAVIRALAKRKDINWKYFIAGTGALREHLEEIIRLNGVEGRVFLLGYRSDIEKLCACADLFILPSLREGLPVALMEAMAMQTPAIASRIRGCSDLLDADEMFDPGDADDIIGCVVRHLQQTNRMARTARQYERLKEFDLERVNQMMSEIYDSCVTERQTEV